MRVLVFNAGSSSLKLGVFDGERQVFKAGFDRFGPGGSDLKIGGETSRAPQPDLAAAIAAVPALLEKSRHPGDRRCRAPSGAWRDRLHGRGSTTR